MVIKIKKKKKSVRMRGTTTHGWGARKKHKKSGHRGGCGMAGTGKKADQKKSRIINLYGNKYFGKQGITSKATRKKTIKTINLRDIEKNIDSLIKKHGKDNELILKKYKVLGDGELKTKLTIKAKDFSKSAKDKIEKIGGKIISLKPPKKEKPIAKEYKDKKENPKEVKLRQEKTKKKKANPNEDASKDIG